MPICWSGTIIVDQDETSSRILLPRKRSLAKAKPASVEMSTTERVTVTDDDGRVDQAGDEVARPRWRTAGRRSRRGAPPGSSGGGTSIASLVGPRGHDEHPVDAGSAESTSAKVSDELRQRRRRPRAAVPPRSEPLGARRALDGASLGPPIRRVNRSS